MSTTDKRRISLHLEIDVVITTLFHAFMSGLTDANLKDGEFDKKWDPTYVKSLINRDLLKYIALLCDRQMTNVFLEMSWADRVDNLEEYVKTLEKEYKAMKYWDVLKRFDDGKEWENFVDLTFREKSIQLQLTGNYRMKARQDYDMSTSIDATHGIVKAVATAYLGYIGGLIVSGKEKVIDVDSFAAILTWVLMDLLNNGHIPEKILREGRPTDYRQYFLDLCGSEAELDVFELALAVGYINYCEKGEFKMKSIDESFKGTCSSYFSEVIKRYKMKL